MSFLVQTNVGCVCAFQLISLILVLRFFQFGNWVYEYSNHFKIDISGWVYIKTYMFWGGDSEYEHDE